MNINKSFLDKFEFTEESLSYFNEKSFIPVDFYNKDGQILIHKNESANHDDIVRLLKFKEQGIYFNKRDLAKIKPPKDKKHLLINGRAISDGKILDPEKLVQFARQSQDLLFDLRKNVMTSGHARSVQKSIEDMLNDFTSNPEFETGIINLVEVLGDTGIDLHSDMMTKRTVVAMGLKVRSRKIINLNDERQDTRDHLNLMSASYLADIGYTRLKLPTSTKLSKDEYNLIKSHPMVSYLMVANNPEIHHNVKKLILNHHRPYKGNSLNNNYPIDNDLMQKLTFFREKYLKDEKRSVAISDIAGQLQVVTNQSSNPLIEEDISTLSLASEFASLTTEQSWRHAFKATDALKMILNNSFFLYSDKAIRDLLDYVGLSLADNNPIIFPGDIVITALVDSEKKLHFDVCRVLKIERFQTRPLLEKLGSINPIFRKDIKYKIIDFDYVNMKLEKRSVIFDLMRSVDNRRIMYLVDPVLNAPFLDAIHKHTKIK
ncbi:MAG: c-di-GMP phosphodiesterase [Leptospira sp.]|nr:c-di-GMP phosphodiesterase [Leptospira sp.]